MIVANKARMTVVTIITLRVTAAGYCAVDHRKFYVRMAQFSENVQRGRRLSQRAGAGLQSAEREPPTYPFSDSIVRTSLDSVGGVTATAYGKANL
jgi:hypothetical protein